MEGTVPVAGGHPIWPDPEPNLVPEPQGNPTGVAGGDGYPASWLGSMADTQGDHMDVGTGRALPASQLDPALGLTWHHRGPPEAKYKDEIGESSQGSSEVLREILTDLDEAAHEVNRETMEALQEGDRRGVPASGGRMGAYSSVDEPGVDDKKNPNAADQNEFRKLCTEGIMVVLGSMLLGMVFCCVIHLWRKRRRRIAAASASQADISRRTSDMGSWIPRSNPSEAWTQQPSPVPAKLPRQPRGRPPRPPPPQVPWLSNSASRVLQDQYSSLDYPETEEPPPRPPKPVPRSRV
ncbi:uncharacterized protein LOC115611613 isoform X2 [Strigops habroptila]|uniref:uncharacterized protein LOC115611613 isoform X2 n=1 Tax=Strigops habroptila TaxID=2489341 RepID=UPI0011CFD836|nr:uncharacterized protein LOC115611613 isoform X2 [Strigops habroptila]